MNNLWTEKYRPKDQRDFDGPVHIKNFLKHAIENGHPHLLLYGPPGTGKTTFASLLNPTLSLNASDERGIDVIRNKIKKVANTVTKQVIVLDECENLTKDAQTCLRRILEDYPNTTFIFCTNYFNKIIGPLKSRLLKFKFTIKENKALEKIGSMENLEFDESFYRDLFRKCGGDLRKSINVLQGIKPLLQNTKDVFGVDELIGRIEQSKIEEFNKIEVGNYKEFINKFIREGFSVLQLIQQLNECLRGKEHQKAEFSKNLAELEGFCFNGCSDEIVLMNLCMKKIEIYN